MDTTEISFNELFKRQTDLFNPEDIERKKVHIFGCGTTGSFTAIALAKLGVHELVLYDFDEIELHNVANQFFRTTDIGKKKTFSTSRLAKEFSPYVTVYLHDEKIDKDSEILFLDDEIIILAFDSLEARKIVYEKAIASGKRLHLIDGRMGGELLRIYVLKNLKKDEEYERSLNTQVERISCSGRSICYNGITIAGIISSLVKKIIKDEDIPREIDFSLKNYDFVRL